MRTESRLYSKILWQHQFIRKDLYKGEKNKDYALLAENHLTEMEYTALSAGKRRRRKIPIGDIGIKNMEFVHDVAKMICLATKKFALNVMQKHTKFPCGVESV